MADFRMVSVFHFMKKSEEINILNNYMVFTLQEIRTQIHKLKQGPGDSYDA